MCADTTGGGSVVHMLRRLYVSSYSYICVLILQAVGLLCTCSDGFFGDTGEHSSVTHLEMMCEFVRLLRRQLEHVPAGSSATSLHRALIEP